MTSTDRIFVMLFKEACLTCFGTPLENPLNEADSRVLSNSIHEKTGLVIGVKSLKNYSQFALDLNDDKKENPSAATLDTLARYVMRAPETSEAERKRNESHYPYWHAYRKKHVGTGFRFRIPLKYFVAAASLLTALVVATIFWSTRTETRLTDSFDDLESFDNMGWQVFNADSSWWQKQSREPGFLTLYTLRGDNWPDKGKAVRIKNLVAREILSPCFSAEIHLRDFVPSHNWQQAGLLLSEDTTFANKVIRLSISYNDFFGGFSKAPEVIIQGLSSSESGSESKPEEFAHQTLFTIGADSSLVRKNLSHASLKIEKRGNTFRFLYAIGPIETFAFKEIVAKDFSIEPKYVALFAIQGISETDHIVPAKFDAFALVPIECNE